MPKVIDVNDVGELESLISDTQGDVVVDFQALSWCIPCRKFAPHFDAAAESSQATFVTCDIDKVHDAVVDYGIQSVPTVKLFRDGVFVTDLKSRTAILLLGEIHNA